MSGRTVRLTTVILGLTMAACAGPGRPAPTTGGTEALIERLERARFAAMVAADTAVLGQYLAPELSYTHSSGASETRAEFLQHLAAGQLHYGSIDPLELHVRVLGETAVLTGRARLVVGNDTFVVRFLDVWSRASGQWQMIAWQSTRLP